jgi:hypothetical protein
MKINEAAVFAVRPVHFIRRDNLKVEPYSCRFARYANLAHEDG